MNTNPITTLVQLNSYGVFDMDNSEVPDLNIKFCPECGTKIEKPTIRCMHCGKPFVDLNDAPNEGIIQTTNKKIQIETKHVDKEGLSFDYPDYYLMANIPPNNPDCVVALAKDDGLCDIMVEVSSAPKMQYQEGIFEKKFEEHIGNLGFYDFTVIHGFGPNKACIQAYSNTDMGVVKTTTYFDLNYNKDLRVVLNTLVQYDYDCIDDLKVIAKNLEYAGESNIYVNSPNFNNVSQPTGNVIIPIIGYILAILFPFIGAIYGAILYFAKKENSYYVKHAKYIICVAIAIFIISLALTLLI